MGESRLKAHLLEGEDVHDVAIDRVAGAHHSLVDPKCSQLMGVESLLVPDLNQEVLAELFRLEADELLNLDEEEHV